MPPTNDFIPFCPTDTGTNLLSEADYAAAADRISGNKPGVASAKLNNKALRQSTAVAAGVASLVSLITGASTLDDGDAPKLYGQIASALTAFPPVITSYLSGTGSHLLTFIFSIASGSATAGATYTNNGFTFTVKQTVASGLILKATGTGFPAVSGALTKATGTGDATLVFYAVRAPAYLKVVAVGGGGGGGGGATAGGASGTDGTDTTFGSSFILAGGGQGGGTGVAGSTPNTGGAASIGAGGTGIAVVGSPGSSPASSGTGFGQGGTGGYSPFGGAGTGPANATGTDASVNSGSGGGAGGGTGVAGYPGAGGASGGYVNAVVPSPLASYAYAVGTGGSGAAGTTFGGAGADGQLLVEEHYQ